jgi:hypothetical protein
VQETRYKTKILASDEGHETSSRIGITYATMQPPLEPPSASIGVEVSGAASGSEKMALTEKSDVKESIDVLRGRKWFCECE